MMTRRELFGGVCAATAAGTAVIRNGATPWRYGELTVERHRELARGGQHLHVFHDGRDVTTECCWADDDHDRAELLVRDRDGRVIGKRVVFGIQIREGAPL